MGEQALALAASADEIRDLEAYGRRGWPALESVDLGGWVVGSSGQHTRRANSTAPVASADDPIDDRVHDVEAFYSSRAQASVFKMTTAARPAGLDAELASRGYARESETVVMTVPLADVSRAKDGPPIQAIVHADGIPADWFDASVAHSEISVSRQEDYRALLARIAETADAHFFGRSSGASELDSVALGCVTGPVMSIHAVATRPSHRGNGLAEGVLRRIFERATSAGVQTALLSVEAENTSARRLYERLGFVERYRYWYRVRSTRTPS